MRTAILVLIIAVRASCSTEVPPTLEAQRDPIAELEDVDFDAVEGVREAVRELRYASAVC